MPVRKRDSDPVKKFALRWAELMDKIQRQPEIAFWVVIFTVVLGLLSNIVASKLEKNFDEGAIPTLVGVIFVAAIAIFWYVARATSPQLPDGFGFERLPTQCISTPADVRNANAITREVFGSNTIDDAEVERILMKNKRATLGLFDEPFKNGPRSLIGYASCWPIRRDIYERMRLGEGDPMGMSEGELLAEHVLSDTELDKAEVLFIPAIAVLDRERQRGVARAAKLAFDFLQHVRTTYEPAVEAHGGIRIFLVGFTREGRRITQRMAGHLGLQKPTGKLTIYGEENVPFYDTYIRRADWSRAFEGFGDRLLELLFSQNSQDKAS